MTMSDTSMLEDWCVFRSYGWQQREGSLVTRIIIDDWNVARNEGQNANPCHLPHRAIPGFPKSCRLYAHLSNRIVPDKKVVIFLPNPIFIPAGQHGDLCLHPRLTRQLSNQIRWQFSSCFHALTERASTIKDLGFVHLHTPYVSAPKHLLLHLFSYLMFSQYENNWILRTQY